MSSARLSASVEATGLVRRAQAAGDFAAILHKGDAARGAILIVVRSRGGYVTCLERTLVPDGRYLWSSGGPADSDSEEKLAEFCAKRLRFDEDLWLIELDIAHPERFIAETTSTT
ncbi:MAG TPA: DUF1491 family protein [Sphingomicrobium sp.]|nr:DUF1491 family protein [Sphingomicrobium sp.]